MKSDVHIHLQHLSESEKFIHSYHGHYYDVTPLGYLRYDEVNDETGITSTTIRLLPDELRIIRRGAIESQFVLRPSEKTAVSYRIGGNQLQLTAYTNLLEYLWSEHERTIHCVYELWLDERLLDRIDLKFDVTVI